MNNIDLLAVNSNLYFTNTKLKQRRKKMTIYFTISPKIIKQKYKDSKLSNYNFSEQLMYYDI